MIVSHGNQSSHDQNDKKAFRLCQQLFLFKFIIKYFSNCSVYLAVNNELHFLLHSFEHSQLDI